MHTRVSLDAAPLAAAPTDPSTASSAVTPSASSLPPAPLFTHFASAAFRTRTALVSGPAGVAFSYAQLLAAARSVQALLQSRLGRSDCRDLRIAILQPAGFDFTAVLLGVWLSGAIAVPLHPGHPAPELEYILTDSGAAVLVVGEEHAAAVAQLRRPSAEQNGSQSEMQVVQWGANSASASTSSTPAALDGSASETQVLQWGADSAATSASSAEPQPISYGSASDFLSRRALLIYTSGTTGAPKGVVWTHAMLDYQMRTLTELWAWSENDRILNVLPLHHVHGLINVLLCALYAGASCVFPPHAKAGAAEIAQMLMDSQRGLNVFMAVPTIYSRILSWLETQPASVREGFRSAVSSRFRLMVSGSSAAPLPVLQGWKHASGIELLERYGMSEAGMILSQPLDPARRIAGTVGSPLPGVRTKIVPREEDESGSTATAAASSSASASGSAPEIVGDLRIQGPGVFREYWNRPAQTAAEFDEEGWFKTGDVVSVSSPALSSAASAAAASTSTGSPSSEPVFRMLGRSSVDVLKSAGYKISALDVERELLGHPEVAEVAVVGLPDEQYGQVVAAILVLKPGASCSSAASLSQWCRSRLASYQIPRVWRIVKEIPKNAMGKTNKKQLIKSFASAEHKDGKA